ncbi:MAG TPA: hydroxymethylbilane synthase, partial [Dehalococcoidia bacterium]
MRPLVLGTRGSALARRQAELAVEALLRVGPDVEIETRVIRTEGDRRRDVPLEEIGGEGVFVKDIERRLAKGEIDLAVHSLKDMPAQTPEGLEIGAVLRRGDPRDALVSRDGARLTSLPAGARIGTDSRRRAVQLLALRPDVRPASIRGNVDTRLRKVAAGEYDAAVLAVAGLERLGLLRQASQLFSVDELLPAVGQGALAIECRADDDETLALLALVDHKETRLAVTAERAFL